MKQADKILSEMSLEELWQLFPIVLTAHRDEWVEWYEEGAALLREGLQGTERISHIGSTAIKGIRAKPTVDILVEVSKDRQLSELKEAVGRCGYLCMAESRSRIDFNKGYTPHGFAERVFHLHLRYAGDNDELYFRDYLSENAAAAKEYERLKLNLWKRYEHDRDAYIAHKSNFVKLHTEKGKQLFGNKYRDEG